MRRKEQFSEWQQSYIEKNNDLNVPKELIREESRRTLELSVPQQTDKDSDSRKKMDKEKVKDEKRRSSVRSKYVLWSLFGSNDSFLKFEISFKTHISIPISPIQKINFKKCKTKACI